MGKRLPWAERVDREEAAEWFALPDEDKRRTARSSFRDFLSYAAKQYGHADNSSEAEGNFVSEYIRLRDERLAAYRVFTPAELWAVYKLESEDGQTFAEVLATLMADGHGEDDIPNAVQACAILRELDEKRARGLQCPMCGTVHGAPSKFSVTWKEWQYRPIEGFDDAGRLVIEQEYDYVADEDDKRMWFVCSECPYEWLVPETTELVWFKENEQ